MKFCPLCRCLALLGCSIEHSELANYALDRDLLQQVFQSFRLQYLLSVRLHTPTTTFEKLRAQADDRQVQAFALTPLYVVHFEYFFLAFLLFCHEKVAHNELIATVEVKNGQKAHTEWSDCTKKAS